MRYFVRAAGGEPLAVLGFGAAAWKIAPQLVGPETRHLPLAVNNARFLILPWVRIKNLASLALCCVTNPDLPAARNRSANRGFFRGGVRRSEVSGLRR